jgi:hypothetical protein
MAEREYQRDESGRFGEGGASKASAKAAKATKDAGGGGSHRAAEDAHRDAQEAWRSVGDKARAAGDHAAASQAFGKQLEHSKALATHQGKADAKGEPKAGKELASASGARSFSTGQSLAAWARSGAGRRR